MAAAWGRNMGGDVAAVTLSEAKGPKSLRAEKPLGRDGASSLYSRPSGQVAQLVEQRTENPRVGGSIPSLATHAVP